MGYPVNCVAFSPDNELLAGAAVNKQIKLYKLATERQSFALSGHSDNINDAKFSYPDRCLISGSSDRTL